MAYLEHSICALRTLKDSARRAIVKRAFDFCLANGLLWRRERTGQVLSRCLLKDEVSIARRWAHENHGHFPIAVDIKRLVGRFWWPMRYSDVFRYYQACAA